MNWKTWALVGVDTPELNAEIMSIVGVEHDPKRGVPIFNGTLGEFQQQFKKPFTVYSNGFYIRVGE